MHKNILLIFVFLLFICNLPIIANIKHVLYINSYSSNFNTYNDQYKGITSQLKEDEVLFDIEFMNSKKYTDPTSLNLFKKQLTHKISINDYNYDAIITSDDDALVFALKEQHDLFNKIPIVFLGVNNIDLALQQNNNPYITGIVEHVSMEETLQTMHKLFPKAKTFYALSDCILAGKDDLKSYYKCQSFLKDITLKSFSLDSISFEELGLNLKNLEENTPLLLLSLYTDKNNKHVTFENGLHYIKKNAPHCPLFHLWRHGLGNGIIGGKIISHYQQGLNAGRLLKQILNGKDIDSLKVITKGTNAYIFDYNELEKFNISLRSLPTDSTILNKPTNFFLLYKFQILGGLSFFFFILALFLFLINKRIKKILTLLRKKNTHYKILTSDFKNQKEKLVYAKQKAEESNKLKSKLIHTLSHEIRTPINGIMGFSELLVTTENLDLSNKEMFKKMINENCSQLVKTMDNLLLASSFETKKQKEEEMTSFSLNQLLNSIIAESEIKAKDKGLYIKKNFKLTDQESVITSNQKLLQTSLINLIENAIVYTQKGFICISYHLSKDKKNLFIHIKDTGIGIKEEIKPNIFNYFTKGENTFSNYSQGLGLGLFIVKKSIKLIGGTVSFKSERNQGSIFTIKIPYKK